MTNNNNEIINNRNNLIGMMAVCEDITRTNYRILEMLRSVMNNPEMKDNIDISVDDLLTKVNKLKNNEFDIPLSEEEKVEIPGPEDISPKKDINLNYQPKLETLTDKPPQVVEEYVEQESFQKESPPLRKPKQPKKREVELEQKTKQPQRRSRKPLQNRKRPTPPNTESV